MTVSQSYFLSSFYLPSLHFATNNSFHFRSLDAGSRTSSSSLSSSFKTGTSQLFQIRRCLEQGKSMFWDLPGTIKLGLSNKNLISSFVMGFASTGFRKAFDFEQKYSLFTYTKEKQYLLIKSIWLQQQSLIFIIRPRWTSVLAKTSISVFLQYQTKMREKSLINEEKTTRRERCSIFEKFTKLLNILSFLYVEFDRWECLILFSKLSIFAEFGIYTWQRDKAFRSNWICETNSCQYLPRHSGFSPLEKEKHITVLEIFTREQATNSWLIDGECFLKLFLTLFDIL